MKAAAALCLLLCAALAGGAPNLLPGDPRLDDPDHHHHGDHAHGEHAHNPGEHAHGDAAAPAAQGVPDIEIAPATSAAQGVPDIGYTATSGGGGYGVGTVVTLPEGGSRPAQTFGTAPRQPQRASRPAAGGRPQNPFLSGNINLPSSSSFQVPVKPVLPAAQRPTPEPILELNTNPLGGPAGPKGPVRASCPGPASALPCVRDAECDPYTGFLKSDGVKLPYPITKETPTVAIGQCLLPGGGGSVGVCCKRFPRPKPTVPTTAVPLGVDYGAGLGDIKPKPTPRVPNPFLPGYKPASTSG